RLGRGERLLILRGRVAPLVVRDAAALRIDQLRQVEALPLSARLVVHRPEEAVQDESMELRLPPGAAVVSISRVEDATLTLLADPSPRLAVVVVHTLHQDGAPLRIVVLVDVGLIPRL